MRIDENIVKKSNNGEEFYDKFAISQVAAHIVLGEKASCSMIESGIRDRCDGCYFKNICNKLDDVILEMRAASVVDYKEFKFE